MAGGGSSGHGRTVRVVRKIQTQGVHHITLVGAKRQGSIDFWEGLLGMPSSSSSQTSTTSPRATCISTRVTAG